MTLKKLDLTTINAIKRFGSIEYDGDKLTFPEGGGNLHSRLFVLEEPSIPSDNSSPKVLKTYVNCGERINKDTKEVLVRYYYDYA